jgi:hypothetical protein
VSVSSSWPVAASQILTVLSTLLADPHHLSNPW